MEGGGGDSSSPTVSSISGSVEASKIVGASVCIAGTSNCATTDSSGNFTITGFAPPQTLEIKVGDSTIGTVSASQSSITVTPKLLADNNATLAPYIGILLHKAGGCAISASSCNLSNITSLDVNTSDNKPLVQEIAELLTTTSPTTLTIKVNGNDENITSSDLTQYQVAYPEMVSDSISFSGTASVGDFAVFSFDRSTNTLNYNVNGNVFGSQSGSENLTNVYGNIFFTDTNNNFYFFSGSMGVALIDTNNTLTPKAFVIGMQTPPSIDTSLIVNKSFNYLEFDTNGNPSFSRIEINASNSTDTNGTWSTVDETNTTTTGVWNVNGTHLDVFDSNNTKIGNAVIRPSSDSNNGRAGFILDITGGGFGIGIEATPLSPSELSGTFYYLDKDLTSINDTCYGTASLSNDGTSVSFTFADQYCTSNSTPESGSGTLTLNPSVTGLPFNLDGLVQIDSTTYAFIDPVSGYFVAIDTSGPSITIGSNKPLQ